MNVPKRVVLLSGPEDDGYCGEPAMKFRLTYEGLLRATQRDPQPLQPDRLANHKHAIRRVFHEQLKRHWETDKFLLSCEAHPNLIARQPHDTTRVYYGSGSKAPLKEIVASKFHMFGYRFLPLVLDSFSLLCSLDILFLRRDMPGSALDGGDIDNRIKTLIDTLRPPRSQNELVGDDLTPRNGEDPFFCLLQDDKQVSHFSVETDRLLTPGTDQADALVVVTVELRPYYVNMFNLSFA